jgi:5-methylthioadenosine/S-adenosylhomocysteine deaminase
VAHLAALGVPGPDLTLGHGVWLTEAELELVAASDTMICHNTRSNLRLRNGIAPVRARIARRLRVALGLDEAGLNDDRDLFQEMRLVLRLQRTPGMDDGVPTPADVFRMATEHGAATTPFAERIGVLEPGRAADRLLVAWPPLADPYLDPETPVLDALGHRGRAAHVDTGIVAGEVVLREGRPARVDKAEALRALAASLGRPRSPEEAQRRRLARGVPARPPLLRRLARRARARPLLPAQLAALMAGPARVRAGGPPARTPGTPRPGRRGAGAASGSAAGGPR